MTDVLDFIALSLLPSWCGVRAAERLRGGASAGAALDGLLQTHWREEPEKRGELRQRAEAAVRRAADAGITTLPWSHPAYPAAVTAIIDPPPVLWVRGHVEALTQPAVAIVGS